MRDAIVLATKVLALPIRKRARYFIGSTPEEAAHGITQLTEMKRPTYVVMEVENEGAYLYRYSSTGEFCGETWGFDIEYAKGQAEEEFNGYISNWREIPLEADDPVAYILAHPKLFDDRYLVTVKAENIPSQWGAKLCSDVLAAFALHPWNSNVICAWHEEDRTLILQAENDFDIKGLVLREEFFEELLACSESVKIEDIQVVSVVNLEAPTDRE